MTRFRARLFAACGGVGLALAVGALAGVAAASPSACPPEAGYDHCQRFSYTGDDQSFTVPPGVRSIRVLEWGAGGGGASIGPRQYSAGAGGFTTGDVAVRPGQELTVTVGQGGNASGVGFGQDVYGGGGLGGGGRYTGGSGGGMSALWEGGYAVVPVLIAGGGGGASPGAQTSLSSARYPAIIGGGGGGGVTGGSDESLYSGQGGSQENGGLAGSPPASCMDSGLGGTAPTEGERYYGGSGGSSDPEPSGPGAVAQGGGGGGGGYYGGGGGRCRVRDSDYPNGAGGGGSGYVDATPVSGAFTITGTDGIAAGLGKGAPPGAEAMKSPFYRRGLSWGGGLSGAANGGNGQIVIEWQSGFHRIPLPSPRPQPFQTPTPLPTSSRSPSPSPSPSRSPSPDPVLPVSGFPFVQVGVAALVLIGTGGVVSWASRRRRPG
jgi:Glycine rich protein